jgi:hypothetical protein
MTFFGGFCVVTGASAWHLREWRNEWYLVDYLKKVRAVARVQIDTFTLWH